jgi:hypothetical protein
MLLRWQTHLFIDTWHVCEQLETELSRHSVRVRRYLVMHDTVTFGEVGRRRDTAAFGPPSFSSS